MSYPFPFINKNLDDPDPVLYLCFPNKRKIDRIEHAYNIQVDLQSGNATELSSLTFKIPKTVEVNHQLTRYKLYDLMKVKYMIRAKFIWGTNYFTIDNPKLDDGEESWTVHCWLSPFDLQDKLFSEYTTTNDKGEDSPIDIKTALTDALSKSYAWSIGHIDDSLLKLYRSFQVDGTALDFVSTIADEYGAIVGWDTINNKVNMYDAKAVGINKGLHLSWGKYMQSLSQDIKMDDLVTRLHCEGKDGLTFNSISPIGQDYVEDYSYWLGSFKRDENKNVITPSEHMSNDLANALLDYRDLINSNKDKFNGYVTTLSKKQSELTQLNNELYDLNTQLNIIKDNISVQKSADTYFYLYKSYTGTGWSYHTELKDFLSYAIMGSCSGMSSITCQIEGQNMSLQNGKWKVLKRLNDHTGIDISIASNQSGKGNVNIIICMIENDEISSPDNVLLDKYNAENQLNKIGSKQSEVNQKQGEINSIQQNIDALHNLLNVHNNFSDELLAEWDRFIIEDTFSDENYTDVGELMSAGEAELLKRQHPEATFDIGIINFLDLIECQRDWDRLYLNDITTIDYDDGKHIRARILGMNIDYDAGTIQLYITDAKEYSSQTNIFTELSRASILSAKAVHQKKSAWDHIDDIKRSFDDYLSGSIYAGKQPIIGGINETESFDDFGRLSKYNDNIYLRMYRGAIISTSDGGQTWQVIASANGVNAESIIGQLMLDSKTSVVSSDGSVQLNHTGASFSHQGIAIEGGLSKDQIDSDLVNQAQRGDQAKSQVDNLTVGADNMVAKANCFGTVVDLNDNIGQSDWSLQLRYNDMNGFVVPIKVGGEYTISFIAYSNADYVKLNIGLNTKVQSDMTIDHEVNVGIEPRRYSWTVDYQDANLYTTDNLLKFWMGQVGENIDKIIVVTDIQLEHGNVRSAWRANYNDLTTA